MKLRSTRGSVLVHVLVTSIIVMVLAAGMARMLMMRYVAERRIEDGGSNRRMADAAVAQIQTTWAANGTCATVTGFTGGGAPNTCGCTLTQAANDIVVTTAGSATNCTLTVQVGATNN